MTTTARPIFMRPINITSSDCTLYAEEGSEGAQTITLSTGVYPNIIALVGSLFNEFRNHSIGGLDFSFDDDFKIKLTNNGASNINLYFAHASSSDVVRDLLGFSQTITTAIAASGTLTATYIPEHVWLPSYNCSDTGSWYTKARDIYAGKKSKAGGLAGLATGPILKYRDYSFPHELATSVFKSHATDAYVQKRNLEAFDFAVRASVPTLAASPPTNYVWVWNDVNDAIEYPNGTANIFDGTEYNDFTTWGGVDFLYTTSPDTYAWCSWTAAGIPVPTATIPGTNARQAVAVSVNTAEDDFPSASWASVAGP
jgi:hypothetical protein